MTPKEAFVAAGGNLLHKGTQRVLGAADDRARKEAETLAAPPNRWANGAIVTALGFLAVAFFLVVLIGGVTALLIVIPAAEFVAVYEGLYSITSDAGIAGLTTAALFIGMLVLMFLKHVYEDALTNGKPRTGIRRTLSAVASWFGITQARGWDDTGERTKTESDYITLNSALTLAKIAVLSASLLGRLRETISVHSDKPFGEALNSIFTTATGSEVIGALISVIVLLGLLKMLDMGVLFAYTGFRNNAGKLDLVTVKPLDFLELYTDLKEQYESEALEDMTLQLRVTKEIEN